MRTAPCTRPPIEDEKMARPVRLLAFLLCLSALAPNVRAQQATDQQKKTAPKKTAAEADPMAEVRRSSAISLVNALADEARTFRDPLLRARRLRPRRRARAHYKGRVAALCRRALSPRSPSRAPCSSSAPSAPRINSGTIGPGRGN